MKISYTIIAFVLIFTSCSGGDDVPLLPAFSAYPDTALTIKDEADLIGGPVAQGRIGDVLLKNDKIRVIIQKPRKNAGVNSFGGNIIDADIVRAQGRKGEDHFGSMFPLINIEWTVNNFNYEVVSDGSNGTPVKLRAYGKIDVYDYLDLDFIGDVAEGITGQRLVFSNRFDDRKNPFSIYEDLKGLSIDVQTDFTLEQGRNSVRIDTTFQNGGDKEVKFPVGEFLNGSGEVSMLVPGVGFTPDLMTQLGENTPAIVYAGFDGVDVSYGYFFDPTQFIDPETDEPYLTTSISYSGVTGLMFGEEFLKLAPLGGGDPVIHFSVGPGASRTVTAYFVVGNGSAGSVMDAGLAAVGAVTRSVTGNVRDAAGNAVAGATVAVMSKGSTIITYRTDSSGSFAGQLPTGGNLISRQFTDGSYKAVVEVSGYHANGTTDAGVCTPEEFDLKVLNSAHVICVLGETGVVEITGPAIDGETESAMPSRLTIVGEDPSPNKAGAAGRFYSSVHWEPVFGIVDSKYIALNGTIDLTGSKNFNLEPGTYRFVISRGPEYTSYDEVIKIGVGQTVQVGGVTLARAARTKGYISGDFHVHSITSPDSSLSQKLRVLSAAAEGLDVLHSSDHDTLTDYAPVISEMESRGLIAIGSLAAVVGDEVTPNHVGHMNVFPLDANPDDPEGGALDWSDSPKDVVSPLPDFMPTFDELVAKLREGQGEKVVQINHVMDNPTGLPLACGWVTSPFYVDSHGVAPFDSYADPVERRMSPRASGTSFPIAFGDSGLMTKDFDTFELVVSGHLKDQDVLFRSALPTWFNLLNLGVISTATADSDTHRQSIEPIGIPRNYIASSLDPQDGMGTGVAGLDLGEYVSNIKAHKVIVSAGPFVQMTATGDSGAVTEVGGTVVGKKMLFKIDVTAPSWAWFDTIEIFSNTEPVPVDDKTDVPMQGVAADPAEFYKPYHVPRYTYGPTKAWSLSEGTITNWKEDGGVITASVEFEMEFGEDAWVVAVARGTKRTEGYRSLFPIVTNVLTKASEKPVSFDPADLTSFHADKTVGAEAWGLTNPIFVDVDGDSFKGKYEGKY